MLPPAQPNGLRNQYEILFFFGYEHLPPELAAVSEQFALLATKLANDLPLSAETAVALRKLLESKDAAVRSLVRDKRARQDDDTMRIQQGD